MLPNNTLFKRVKTHVFASSFALLCPTDENNYLRGSISDKGSTNHLRCSVGIRYHFGTSSLVEDWRGIANKIKLNKVSFLFPFVRFQTESVFQTYQYIITI